MEITPPSFYFAKIKIGQIQLMFHGDWLHIPIFIIPLSSLLKLGKISDKNTRRYIFNYISMLTSQGYYDQMGEHSCYGLKTACFRTQVSSLGNLQNVFW